MISRVNCYPVHMRNAAQRWSKIHNVGPSPRIRYKHTVASDGTRVFVLGGYSEGAWGDELIHVFDTSMYFRSLLLSGQFSKIESRGRQVPGT